MNDQNPSWSPDGLILAFDSGKTLERTLAVAERILDISGSDMYLVGQTDK